MFGEFLIIGVLVSVIVQFIKKKVTKSKNETMLIVLTLSVLSGIAYYFIKDNAYLLEAIVSILGFAGAVYTFIIKRF